MRRNNKKGKLPRKRQFTPVLHRKRHTRRSFIRSFCVCLCGLPDWGRTSGLESRSLTLYPTELQVDNGITYYIISFFRLIFKR